MIYNVRPLLVLEIITRFNRLNAQTTYLTDFIRINNVTVSWDHQVSNKDNTYNNFSLNHFSSIDHFIITHNIYDSIISNNVINEVTNPSNHNAILLSFSLNIILAHIPTDLLLCTDCKCMDYKHKHAIDLLCRSIIMYGLKASSECIPITRSRAREVAGWTDHVKPERDRSVFWHWMWLESGKPNTGFIYQIMKGTRHQYHYAVRRCKSNKLNIQKQRLAENIHNSTNFWREIKKINPANKLSTTIMDNANGDKEITSLLVNKYETLYSSVPTDDNEMNQLHLMINEGIVSQQFRGVARGGGGVHMSPGAKVQGRQNEAYKTSTRVKTIVDYVNYL